MKSTYFEHYPREKEALQLLIINKSFRDGHASLYYKVKDVIIHTVPATEITERISIMKNSNSKRIGAIIGIVAILSLYIISFIIGVFFSDKYPQLFMASVFIAVIIPIIVYCFIAVYRYVHKKAEYNKSEETDEIDK